MKKTAMLMILDGYGIAPAGPGNAIEAAKKPNLDKIFSEYPNTTLSACGSAVGLPEGQMGNSEVGHMNIGAGRIIYQELSRISNDIRSGAFFENEVISDAFLRAKNTGKTLHLMGLLSDGGVHSHIDHLFALIDMAREKGVEKLCVHAFLDGRDVPPRCAEKYLSALENKLSEVGLGEIGVISGRYYAMDRDKRWDRVRAAYDALTLGAGCDFSESGADGKPEVFEAPDALSALKAAYGRGENDEFVRPTVVGAFPGIGDGDSVLMFNFRPDRARELSRALTDGAFDGFLRKKVCADLRYVCMTTYDASLGNVEIAYPPEEYKNTLGEYAAGLGLRQLRIAETEKYAHVTFFFNGGVEKPNEGEDRILIPSPAVATYDLKPEMSAFELTERVLAELEKDSYELIILNFANCDMVGHTGVFDAAVKAVEAVDECVGRITAEILKRGGQILLTADHGNADVMLDKDGNVVTSHSLSPVPLVHIAENARALRPGGKLADIAPTLLTLMGLPVPAEMSGDVLV